MHNVRASGRKAALPVCQCHWPGSDKQDEASLAIVPAEILLSAIMLTGPTLHETLDSDCSLLTKVGLTFQAQLGELSVMQSRNDQLV